MRCVGLVSLVLVGCSGYYGLSAEEELARVRERALFDLSCREVDTVVLESFEATGIPRTVGVRGCEQQATYLCVAGATSCTWTMDAASRRGRTTP